MALVIILTIAEIVGIVYGIKKNNKKIIVISTILLAITWILSGIYYYIGLKNPY